MGCAVQIWHEDFFPLIQPAVENTFSLPIAGLVQIADFSPQRIALVIGNATSSAFVLTTSANPVANQGFQVTANQGAIIFSWELHRGLVKQQWFAQSTGGVTLITVLEVTARVNPAIYGWGDAYAQRKLAADTSVRTVAPSRSLRLAGGRRTAAIPRFLRERLPGILTGE